MEIASIVGQASLAVYARLGIATMRRPENEVKRW
jgi:hypothetical protein